MQEARCWIQLDLGIIKILYPMVYRATARHATREQKGTFEEDGWDVKGMTEGECKGSSTRFFGGACVCPKNCLHTPKKPRRATTSNERPSDRRSKQTENDEDDDDRPCPPPPPPPPLVWQHMGAPRVFLT